jgi:hypothetical protein
MEKLCEKVDNFCCGEGKEDEKDEKDEKDEEVSGDTIECDDEESCSSKDEESCSSKDEESCSSKDEESCSSKDEESCSSKDEESCSSNDDEICSIIRSKNQIDGASTLDEAIEMLYDFIGYLKELKADGYELKRPVEDDYGFIKKTPINFS